MTEPKFLETARRVVRTEAAALGTLANSLGDGIVQAVELILNSKGRVIISGMGKSGHIARKIAATLSSTGTPAYFVHPAEASHGDLGMMTPDDIVMVLSNSGETPELADLIAYSRRYSIPMIGVASREDSNLMRQSDVKLVLPKAEEACGTGVVPTSSTTMTLALGDALAIALMEHREFTESHFRNFHPGGKLGARLSKVEDLMHDVNKIPLVSMDTLMGDVLLEITEKGFGVAGVLDEKQSLIGIVTDGDLRRNLEGLMDKTAGDVMTKNPVAIAPFALAEQALAIMQDRKITSLFVTTPQRKALGLLHVHDCLRAGLG